MDEKQKFARASALFNLSTLLSKFLLILFIHFLPVEILHLDIREKNLIINGVELVGVDMHAASDGNT